MSAQRYRKRPVEIEALRWTGDNFDELTHWCDDHVKRNAEGTLRLFVKANTAWLEMTVGEWVAKDRHGFYPIKDDVFMESYELVTDGNGSTEQWRRQRKQRDAMGGDPHGWPDPRW